MAVKKVLWEEVFRGGPGRSGGGEEVDPSELRRPGGRQREKKVRFGGSSPRSIEKPGWCKLNSPRQEGEEGGLSRMELREIGGGKWKIAVGPLVRAWCAALLFFRLGGSGRVFWGGEEEPGEQEI